MKPPLCWLALERELPPATAWLSPGETQRLAEMRFAKRRNDFLLGRWAAKRVLSCALGLSSHPEALAELDIGNDTEGAPRLLWGECAGLASLSISHRDGAALAAAAGRGVRLGCDLERVEPRSDAFVADYFTDEEQERVAGVPLESRALATAVTWSAKESALKALGTGLRHDTRHVPVRWDATAAPGTSWQPLSVAIPEGAALHGWWRRHDRWVCTLVSEPLLPAPRMREPAIVLA